MHLHRLVAVPSRAAVSALLALFALGGCSSSTEPKSNLTPDGFAISLTLDTASARIGGWIAATMAIENTTSAELSRTFPAGDWGPLPQASNLNLSVGGSDYGFFDDIFVNGLPHKLTVAAHQSVMHVFHFQARTAGTSYISACFPDGDTGPRPAACVKKTVIVTSN
jgi:hypothetical protein